jgi:hypothetical protein
VALSVDLVGYLFAGVLASALVMFAARERRWWNWLQVAGIALLALEAVVRGAEPHWLRAVSLALGPPILVAGLVAWRLHWDAGWFGGDELRRPPNREKSDNSPPAGAG